MKITEKGIHKGLSFSYTAEKQQDGTWTWQTDMTYLNDPYADRGSSADKAGALDAAKKAAVKRIDGFGRTSW